MNVMGEMKFYFLWLAGIMIVVFILQSMIPGFTEMFVLNDAVYSGQVWRYVSAVFLHGGIVHLLYNLFALLLFGMILEKLVGSRRFLAVFFVSGIVANVIAVNFYSSSLGASGAIYGILGMIAIVRPFMMVWAFGLIMPMFIAVILWIAGDFLRIMSLIDPGNTGSIAHLSGVVVGILFGLFLGPERVNKKKRFDIPEEYVESWEKRYMKG